MGSGNGKNSLIGSSSSSSLTVPEGGGNSSSSSLMGRQYSRGGEGGGVLSGISMTNGGLGLTSSISRRSNSFLIGS